MKILLVTLDFWPKIGGVANYYLNLCRELSRQEKDSVVVLTGKDHEASLSFREACLALPRRQAGDRQVFGVADLSLPSNNLDQKWQDGELEDD